MSGVYAVAILGGVAVAGFFAGWIAPGFGAPEMTHAIGVISQCGIYAVATIDSNGVVELYDAARQASEAVAAQVNALAEAARTTIVVPCPEMGTRAFQ